MRIGRLAAHQLQKRRAEVVVLPRVDDRVHAGIGHRQGEGDLVVESRFGFFVVPAVDGDDEVGQPADGEAAEDCDHNLKKIQCIYSFMILFQVTV